GGNPTAAASAAIAADLSSHVTSISSARASGTDTSAADTAAVTTSIAYIERTPHGQSGPAGTACGVDREGKNVIPVDPIAGQRALTQVAVQFLGRPRPLRTSTPSSARSLSQWPPLPAAR